LRGIGTKDREHSRKAYNFEKIDIEEGITIENDTRAVVWSLSVSFSARATFAQTDEIQVYNGEIAPPEYSI